MSDHPYVDTHGAVSLGAPKGKQGQQGGANPRPARGGASPQGGRAAAAGAGARSTGPQLDAPLITDVTTSTFEDVVSTSQTVPVVMVLWSGRTLESTQLVHTLEQLTREYAGRFQLAKVDVDSNAEIAQALQAQSVPTCVAVVGGHPLPLFQGTPATDEVRGVLDQVLQYAEQSGVRGTIPVAPAQAASPEGPDYAEARAAEASGNVDRAVQLWERVVRNHPQDAKAPGELGRVKLAQRLAGGDRSADPSDPFVRSDGLFAAGDVARAFDVLLGVLADASDGDVRERARERLLEYFAQRGQTPEVAAARRRLSTLLMI